MAESTPSNDINKALFLNLVAMLSATTMQYMGKIINPMTGKTEINLDAAQGMIDMLEMIEAKSHGNLDREEERFVKQTLTTLRMNFVETKTSKPAETAAAQPEPAPAGTPPTGDSSKEPKFHKSYG